MLGRIRSAWKRYGYFLLPLAVGCVTGLVSMGSPADKQYRFLTFLFLGMGVIGIAIELFRLGRATGHGQPVDDLIMGASAPSLTPASTDADVLLRAEQLLYPETIGLPLTIKPSPRNAVPLWIGLVALGGLAVYPVIQFRLTGAAVLIPAAIAGGLAILTLWFRRRYFSGTSLFVDQREAGMIPAFGRRKAVSTPAIRNVALRQVTYGKGAVRKLILVGKDGRALLAVTAEGFSVADAALFAAALRVPVDATWQPVTASKLRREIPGAVTPVYRYAMAASIVLAALLFIVILVLSPRPGH
jgi:hypothetical protein